MIADRIYKDAIRAEKCVFLIPTNQEYLISAAKSAILKLVSVNGECAVESYDNSFKIKDILINTRMGSLFFTKKLIIMDGNFKNIKEEDIKMIENYALSCESDSVMLIIDRHKNFNKLKKNVFIIDTKLSELDCVEEMQEKFNNLSIKISRNQINKLISLSAGNIEHCSKEADKLIAYTLDKKEVADEDIDNVVIKNLDGEVYELVNALTRGDARSAYEELDYFINKGEAASRILSSITNSYRRMFYASISVKLGVDELAKLLNVKPYAITYAQKNARMYKPIVLKKIMDELIYTEYSFKRGISTDKNALYKVVSLIIGYNSDNKS